MGPDRLSSRFAPVATLVASLVATLVASLAASTALPAQSATMTRQLLRDTVIDGVPCASTGKWHAEFHANGRLLECPTSASVKRGDNEFPAGSWLRFTEAGVLDGVWLAKDTRLAGVTCRGDGYKSFDSRYHANGALRLCFLRSDTVVDGVPCLHGSFWTELRGRSRSALLFDEQGRLRQCQASRDVTIAGRNYSRWDVVHIAR